MERLEVINVRGLLALGGDHGANGTLDAGVKGVEVELEGVESVYHVYPATIPFLELLATLLHTPKRVPLKSRITEPEPLKTVPDGLGAPLPHSRHGAFHLFHSRISLESPRPAQIRVPER